MLVSTLLQQDAVQVPTQTHRPAKSDRPLGDMLTVQYGSCAFEVRASDHVISTQLEEVSRRLSVSLLPCLHPVDCRLMVISPYPDGIVDSKYRAIAQAWATARQALRKQNSKGMDAWRTLYQFGKPIDRSIFLFQDRNGGQNDFFCLNPTDTVRLPWSPSSWIIKAIEALGVHWYVTHGGALFHASGVDRNGKGYLFLGPSGAGKSAVARLSEQVQATIVHDDQVLIASVSGQYLLAHPGSRITPPLGAVFLLCQSNIDRTIPITLQATGAGLCKSLLEYAIGQDLYGPWVRQAFQNVSAIARTVPGYELHFRKSPDFWKVIDAELGR